MARARAGILIALCVSCADPEPAEAPSPKPPPRAAELVENLLKPPAGQASPEEMKAICADPASACELYKALREGRAVIQEDPPAPASRALPRR